MIVLGMGGLAIAILIFLLGGPAGALIATLLAALSFPLMILICFWLDRYEPEPARYRLTALGWGAVAAVALSFVGEQLLFGLPGANQFVNTAIAAPLIEESAKGLFLVAIVVFRRAEVHGLLDGIIYGALVGIGFAFVEDIVYYLGSLQSGQLGLTFFLRGIMGPFAHPLFTAATGLGIGIAVSTRRPAVRVLAPILGFLAAVLMHAIWNGSTFFGANGFLIAYGAIMLPLLIVILAVAIWARTPRRQDAHCSAVSGVADGLDEARGDPMDSPTLGSDVGPRVRQTRCGQARRGSASGVPANHDRDRFPAQSSRERDSPR